MKSRQPFSSSSSRTELRLSWGGRFDAATDALEHAHAETELVMVTAGHCRIEVGGRSLDGGEGSLFVLPAGVAQYQTTLAPTKTTFIGFRCPPEIFNESARVLKVAPDDPVRSWLEQLCDWQLVRPSMGAEVTRRLLEVLLRRIAELDAASGTREQMHPAVAAAMTQLEDDLARPLQLAELASKVGVSISHLGALFAEQCGCSPMRYLQERRLERARWLLDNPYLRIHEVAQACGYEDVNYFVRLFRRRFGQPPGRWRRSRIIPPTGS